MDDDGGSHDVLGDESQQSPKDTEFSPKIMTRVEIDGMQSC
jgi:hypothetical protein